MQIVELSDYSAVIMKDSEDPPWVSVGKIYRKAVDDKCLISVLSEHASEAVLASEYICTAGRLILFFKDSVDNKLRLHDKVDLQLLGIKR